jgi:hypothetical protein
MEDFTTFRSEEDHTNDVQPVEANPTAACSFGTASDESAPVVISPDRITRDDAVTTSQVSTGDAGKTPAALTLGGLADVPRWVAWQLEVGADRKRPTKVPYDPLTDRKAEANNPGTWGTRKQAESRSRTASASL